jgi:hypothetical protein
LMMQADRVLFQQLIDRNEILWLCAKTRAK